MKALYQLDAGKALFTDRSSDFMQILESEKIDFIYNGDCNTVALQSRDFFKDRVEKFIGNIAGDQSDLHFQVALSSVLKSLFIQLKEISIRRELQINLDKELNNRLNLYKQKIRALGVTEQKSEGQNITDRNSFIPSKNYVLNWIENNPNKCIDDCLSLYQGNYL